MKLRSPPQRYIVQKALKALALLRTRRDAAMSIAKAHARACDAQEGLLLKSLEEGALVEQGEYT